LRCAQNWETFRRMYVISRFMRRSRRYSKRNFLSHEHPPSVYTIRQSHSKFWNKMYPFARSSRVEASTIGIINSGWVDFRLILVSRAPTYCNHAGILCSCNARSSPSISFLVLHYPPTHPGHPLSVSFFAFVHFPRSLSPGARSMLSYPTDNSIILHAKTASDVLAQSASHLCEQITSYRKTDFIFEEER